MVVPERTDAPASTHSSSSGRSVVALPAQIREIVRRNGHYSDIWREINARYFYNLQKKKEEREKKAQEQLAERLRRREEEKQRRENLYPSNKFKLFDTACGRDQPDIKGSIMIASGQSGFNRVDVVGYAYHLEEVALVVLHPATEGPARSFIAICDKRFLPEDLLLWLKSIKPPRKKPREPEPIELNSVKVKRAGVSLHFFVRAPFRGPTCDTAMFNSLQQGLVMARNNKRTQYITWRLPFVKGLVRDAHQVYVVTSLNGAMGLVPPSRNSSVPQSITEMAALAKERDSLEASSVNSLLVTMEGLSSSAKDITTDRDRCLNIALGGEAELMDYGKFVPCSVLLIAHPFPRGSFIATPCSCDIEKTDSPEVNECLRKMNGGARGKNGESYKVGHNAEAAKKRMASG